MTTLEILILARHVETFSIEAILCKQLMLNKIDSEDKLIERLKHTTLTQHTKVRLQNAYRDIIHKLYDISKLPTL